jgi:DNA-binding response OmpR family regulator
MPHILLVDDDRDCLTGLSNRLRFAFREQSLDIDLADSAASGLLVCHTVHYDALIVDVVMPGTNGFKFVEQLRRTQPHVPIIMMSGWDVKACEEQVARLGLVACLPKPIEFSMLCALVRDVLEQRHGSPDEHGVRQSHHTRRHARHRTETAKGHHPRT